MATTTKRPTTLLSPNDPELGSSYEAGVERARRVNAQKAFDETGVEPVDPNAPAEETDPLSDLRMIQEAGYIPPGVDLSKMQSYKADGMYSYVYPNNAGTLYLTPEQYTTATTKKPKTPSTLLGGG